MQDHAQHHGGLDANQELWMCNGTLPILYILFLLGMRADPLFAVRSARRLFSGLAGSEPRLKRDPGNETVLYGERVKEEKPYFTHGCKKLSKSL
jgi:hypothetical protein